MIQLSVDISPRGEVSLVDLATNDRYDLFQGMLLDVEQIITPPSAQATLQPLPERPAVPEVQEAGGPPV